MNAQEDDAGDGAAEQGWRCEECSSDKWVRWRAAPSSSPLRAQCVPCGHVQEIPRRAEQDQLEAEVVWIVTGGWADYGGKEIVGIFDDETLARHVEHEAAKAYDHTAVGRAELNVPSAQHRARSAVRAEGRPPNARCKLSGDANEQAAVRAPLSRSGGTLAEIAKQQDQLEADVAEMRAALERSEYDPESLRTAKLNGVSIADLEARTTACPEHDPDIIDGGCSKGPL